MKMWYFLKNYEKAFKYFGKHFKRMVKKIEVEFVSQGILKKHMAEIREEKTPFGKFEYIFIEKDQIIPQREIIKIANEKKMPVFYQSYKIFPAGKSMMDFVKK